MTSFLEYFARYAARRRLYHALFQNNTRSSARRDDAPLVMRRRNMKAFAELNDKQDRIQVTFPYSPDAVEAIRGRKLPGGGREGGIPGARFVGKEKGGPYWLLPLDLVTAQRLRESFGEGLKLGIGIKAWGRDEVSKRRNLATLTNADTAELQLLPKENKKLYKYVAKRPYQLADIAMMAQTNVLNANQPGTGKTVEVIGSWIESGIVNRGAHLVIAPVRSLVNVWAEELKWLDIPVFTAEDPDDRKLIVEQGLIRAESEPVVICINADMLRVKRADPDLAREDQAFAFTDMKGNAYVWHDDLRQALVETEYASCTIDEFHKMGLPNRWSLLSLSIARIVAGKKAALSGTPMGGVPRKLWSILNWLEPQEYTSEWRWIETWLEMDEEEITVRGGAKKPVRTVGGIQPGRETEFYQAHARHMVRRLKRDALPGLPPQVHITVMCSMTKKQEKQYGQFAMDAEIRINDQRLSAQNTLAEYSRLKQFANAAQELRGGVPYPTQNSGKLEQLLQKLDEEGIRKDNPEPGARAIIASESSRFVNVVAEFLSEHGIDCDTLTGETKDSKPLMDRFKSNDPRPFCIVMTTQTGGVSLNLEEAGSVHALDETWNPDDQEQLFDRGDRGSRTTPLKCYTYRTKDTIQEYIAGIVVGKRATNRKVLDIRKKVADAMRIAN